MTDHSLMHRARPGPLPGPRLVLILLLAAIVSGCLHAPAPPLRVGTNQWPGYEPLYLARDLGALGDSGIRLVEFTSSTDVMHALRNKTLEAAALTLDEVLTLLQDDIALDVILVMDQSNGADALVARPDIERLEDLRGRRVAVENTAVGALVLDAALREAGLTAGDIDIVPTTVDEHFDAYRNGRVDAVVTFDPVRSRLLSAGATLLFDSSRIPGRVVDVLVVRRDIAGSYDGALRTLLKGHFLALDYLKRHPRDAARRMAPRVGLSPDELLTTYDLIMLPGPAENRRLLDGSPPPMHDAARKLVRLMIRQGLLKRPVDPARLFDARWLPGEVS